MHYLLKAIYSAKAGLSVYTKLKKTIYSRGNYIVIAAMPKSGSTFLSRVLAEVTDYKHHYFAFAYRNIEQELYVPEIIDAYGKGTVVQQHFKANEPNINILNQFSIRPVVLVRNIFDLVISIKDHLTNERLDNLPSVYPSQEFLRMDENTQLDYIIEYIIPWYFTYYVSWYSAKEEQKIEILWLSYEDLVKDWTKGIEQILNFYQITKSEEDISKVLQNFMNNSRQNTRFNKGITGRGEKILNDRQKSTIVHLTSYYPDIDFSMIGINKQIGLPPHN